MNSVNLNTRSSSLPATHDLLAEIAGKADYQIISALKSAVLHFGSMADAEEILKYFREYPTEFFGGDLLEIVGKWGDRSQAERIFDLSFTNNRLNENFPEEVLEVLGQLKFDPAKPVLAHYAFHSSEYYLNRSAVLGLLHFDCREYQQEIKKSITHVLGKNLFPEYLPALVCKLDDKRELLEQLYNSGSTTISTDCNAGIFLGFSLCGEEGRSYFKNALFDPNWEAYYNAARIVLTGMHNLGISFEQLLEEAGKIEDEKMLQYHMLVIISLLEVKAASYRVEGESFLKVYRQLISTQTLSTLAEKAGQLPDAQRVEEFLILRMKEEVMLRSRI